MRQSIFRCWFSEDLDTAGEQVFTTLRPIKELDDGSYRTWRRPVSDAF